MITLTTDELSTNCSTKLLSQISLHVCVGEFIQSYISTGVISSYYRLAQLVTGPSRLILSCKPMRGGTCLFVMNSRCNPTLFPYLHSNEGRITKKKKDPSSYQPASVSPSSTWRNNFSLHPFNWTVKKHIIQQGFLFYKRPVLMSISTV